MVQERFNINDLELIGDINNDDSLDILDVVLLVNIVLNNENYLNNADLNNDFLNNVLDVVLLVNLILDN